MDDLEPAQRPVVWIWGLPIVSWTTAQVLDEIDHLVAAGQPAYFITANLNYAMLSDRYPDLRQINRDAAFIVADGMPLLWAARRQGTPLPERVAGSDLIYSLAARAAEKGYRLFFLGATPEAAQTAVRRLIERYPGLQVVGIENPPFRPLTAEEERELARRIQAARPDILIGAFTQPKGDRWIFANYRSLGVPVCVQLGATLDFVAGRIERAPRWIQRAGLEWLIRLMKEPRRLGPRYWHNGLFFLRQTLFRPVGTRDESAVGEGQGTSS